MLLLFLSLSLALTIFQSQLLLGGTRRPVINNVLYVGYPCHFP
uniref:Uncharacterized protein n=1 Tax=Arundo donax TaxID=35708 RepID=A0A0A9G8Z9_ARUDO